MAYTYDDSIVPTGRLATVTEVIDGQSVTSSYSYDDQGRLTSYTPALPAGYGCITYTWSLSGQKTSMTVPVGNNSAKRYSYCYDREGRQVGMNVEAVSVTSSPTLTAGTSGNNTRFFYDNSRNRVKLITKSGDSYYFVYDPTASIPAVVYEAVNTTTYLNVREPSGSLISREKYEDGDLVYSRTYHFDGLGSAIALTDEDGTTTDTYSYDAWGNLTSHTDPDTEDGIGLTTDNPYQYVGKYGYYTHWQEPTLNLLQLGVRYYDPSVGRFTQQDPIQDGWNWYGYVGENPVTNVDPTGLATWLGPKPMPDGTVTYDLTHCEEAMRQCMNDTIKRTVVMFVGTGFAAGTTITFVAQVGKCANSAVKWVATIGTTVVDVSTIVTLYVLHSQNEDTRKFCCRQFYACLNRLARSQYRRGSSELHDTIRDGNEYLEKNGCTQRISGDYYLP